MTDSTEEEKRKKIEKTLFMVIILTFIAAIVLIMLLTIFAPTIWTLFYVKRYSIEGDDSLLVPGQKS